MLCEASPRATISLPLICSLLLLMASHGPSHTLDVMTNSMQQLMHVAILHTHAYHHAMDVVLVRWRLHIRGSESAAAQLTAYSLPTRHMDTAGVDMGTGMNVVMVIHGYGHGHGAYTLWWPSASITALCGSTPWVPHGSRSSMRLTMMALWMGIEVWHLGLCGPPTSPASPHSPR